MILPVFSFFKSSVLVFSFQRQTECFSGFFTWILTESESENQMTSRPKSYEFRQHPHTISFCISGSLKNVGLSLKRRKRTHLLIKYYYYSVSSTNQAAFFIGGYDGSSRLSAIAKYESDEWSLHGNLKRRRGRHGSITYGTTTLVIGGQTDDGS